MRVKNDVFVNFLFHHLCQYGGWVCCSNERVQWTTGTRNSCLWGSRLLMISAVLSRYLLSKTTVTLEPTSGVTQGHRKGWHSMDHVRLSVDAP